MVATWCNLLKQIKAWIHQLTWIEVKSKAVSLQSRDKLICQFWFCLDSPFPGLVDLLSMLHSERFLKHPHEKCVCSLYGHSSHRSHFCIAVSLIVCIWPRIHPTQYSWHFVFNITFFGLFVFPVYSLGYIHSLFAKFKDRHIFKGQACHVCALVPKYRIKRAFIKMQTEWISHPFPNATCSFLSFFFLNQLLTTRRAA